VIHKKQQSNQLMGVRLPGKVGSILSVLLLFGVGPVLALPNDMGGEVTAPIVIETATTTSVEKVLDRSEAQRLVFVGETHTSLSDHQLQLDVLKAMHRQGGELAVGVEWIQRPFQKVLDKYIDGELEEKDFLRESEYFSRWGFDYRLYRDIFAYAREHRIPVYALNASRELSRAIREKGLQGISDEWKAKLPASYDFDDEVYAGHLKQVFRMHANRNEEDSQAFRRFLEVQLTWDETMAEGIANYLSGAPERRMLVLAGRGHTHAAAIPSRVERRIGIRGLSIASYQPGDLFQRPDFMVLQAPRWLPSAGLIGIGLEEREDGVYVTSIADDSHAGDAGIQKGDRILRIGNTEIDRYVDVKLAMLDRSPGDKLQVLTSRSGLFGISSENDALVELISRRN